MIRAFAIALLLMSTSAFAEDVPRTISVSGTGEVTATPDMASVFIGAQSEAGTAEEALARTAEAVDATLRVLEGAGIEARDLQTRGINLSPRLMRQGSGTNAPPRIVGYVASSDLTVRIRDLNALGPVLDAVVSAGANTLGGITFGLQEIDAAREEAQALAIADARAKADTYAQAAGVSVGPVLSISDGGAVMPQGRMMFEASMADAAVPVAPGELTVSAQVDVVYEIAD